MTKHQTRPTTAAIHAAEYATKVTHEAVKAGMDPVAAQARYAAAYAAAIREAA